MKKNQCVHCGQMLKKAPADAEYCWIGKTDNQGYCYAGATEVNGVLVSEQEHCTESEMG
jgi:hypothetical protein